MAYKIKVLFENDDFVAIDKPWGYHVHPPESEDKFVPREKILLYKVRQYLNTYAYPVHRLDVATKGVLIFAKSKESAAALSEQIRQNQWQKTYLAVVRGHINQNLDINIPLKQDTNENFVEARTLIHPIKSIELEEPVGKKFPTARYTLVRATPVTGKFHQIRRHLNRISHPVLGDAAHGDSYHNRFFRNKLKISGLCLLSYNLTMPDQISITCELDEKWDRVLQLFACDPKEARSFLSKDSEKEYRHSLV